MPDGFQTIPDLPSGWTSGGPLTVLVLIVLLFLMFMLVILRVINQREDGHTKNILDLSKDLTAQHGRAMENQLEHCKEEVTNTIKGYVGQVSILTDQNDSMWKLIHNSEDRQGKTSA